MERSKVHDADAAATTNLVDVHPRIYVSLAFGRTFSSFAFAEITNPRDIFLGIPEDKPEFLISSYYKEKSLDAASITKRWELKAWGNPAPSESERSIRISRRAGAGGLLPSSLDIFLTGFIKSLAQPDYDGSSAAPLPPGLTLTQVITDYLREMGTLVLKTLKNKYGEQVTKQVIQWSVTLPSLWHNSIGYKMKSLMVGAGLVDGVDGSPHPLRIIAEHEALSFYCINDSHGILHPEVGDRLLIAVIGEETTDIVVHEVVGCGETLNVKEVTRMSSSDLCFDSLLLARFMNFLHERIGPCLQECIQKHPHILTRLIQRWEIMKSVFGDPAMKDEVMDVDLPNRLVSDWEKYDVAFGRPQRENYDEVEVSYSDMQVVFDPVVELIIGLIERHLAHTLSPLKGIAMVGAGAGSRYLVESIKRRFSQYSILQPPDPKTAACQGAVGLLMHTTTPFVRVVDTMESDFLKLATESAKNARELTSTAGLIAGSTSPLQFNGSQCRHLSDALTAVVNDVMEQILSLNFVTHRRILQHQEIFKNLYLVAKEIERLIADCCKDQWLQSAVMLVDMTEHVSRLLFDLKLYMPLLRHIVHADVVERTLKEVDHYSRSLRESSTIESISRLDQDALLWRVKQVLCVSRDSIAQGGSELAAKYLEYNLLQRISLREFPGGHKGLAGLELWKVNHKDLRRKKSVGKGSFATVHKVEWLGEVFAEKCYFHTDNPESLKSEAYVLSGLSHPNIVTVLGYAESNISFSLIMELMNGDLHDLMHRKMHSEDQVLDFPFDLPEAIDIMLQIAEGMRYLHEKRIVHRDLKAANILVKCEQLGASGKSTFNRTRICAKVSDFGLSKINEKSCTSHCQTSNTGSTRWMAPELFSSATSSTAKSYPFKVDVYSFGMLCIEILTGQVPEYGVSQSDLRKMMVENPGHGVRPHIPRRCPLSLGILITKCWKSTPYERPSFSVICDTLRNLKICSLMMGMTIMYPQMMHEFPTVGTLEPKSKGFSLDAKNRMFGLKGYKLNLWCESQERHHEVDNQNGLFVELTARDARMLNGADQQVVEEWLPGLLKDRNITECFGLYRVIYVNNGDVAWICQSCMESGKSKQILECLNTS